MKSLFSGDILADKVCVRGTAYAKEDIVVTKVFSRDFIQAGVIQKIVARQDHLLFIVSVYTCARHRFRFFESLPTEEVKLIDIDSLCDYKPLVRRGGGICFKFFLHHNVPISP
jgi:hypothetical protein